MAVVTTVEPIERDIALLLDQELSPAAQARALAAFAKESIEEATQANRRALGREPAVRITVDGRAGAALETVKPNGEIVAEFEIVGDVLTWIAEQLAEHSPVGGGERDRHPGQYRESHVLFADGALVAAGEAPVAHEYVFVNLTAYARKIERGMSSQAPDGVYQVVASLARQRFGNMAKIEFNYRTPSGAAIVTGRAGNRSGGRNPAIVVTLR